MRGLLIRVIVLGSILLLISAGQSFSQSPLTAYTFSGDFNGAGARAAGMGNAFIGVSNDISAVTWNPAGLKGFEKPIIGFSVSSTAPRGKYDDFGRIDINSGLQGSMNQVGSFSQFSFLGFLSPIRIRGHQFIFSGAYSRITSDYSSARYAYQSPFQFYIQAGSYSFIINDTSDNIGEVSRKSNPYKLSVGFGTRLYNNIDFGFAVNSYMGRETGSQFTIASIPEFTTPLLVGGQSVYYEQKSLILDTFKYSGINFTFGFKAKMTKVDIGLVIKTGYSLNLKGGFTNSDSTFYEHLPAQGTSFTTYRDNQLYKYSIPWIIGLGFGYTPKENLLLAMDVEYRPFEGEKVKVRDSIRIKPGATSDEYFTEYDPLWDNSITIRTGAEYRLITSSAVIPQIPLRVGFGYIPTAGHGYSNTGSSMSVTQYKMSCGAGIKWSQIDLDFAYTYSTCKIGAIIPVGFFPSYGESKAKKHMFDITFTGYF